MRRFAVRYLKIVFPFLLQFLNERQACKQSLQSWRAGEQANEASREKRAGASGEAAGGIRVPYSVRGVTSRDSPRCRACSHTGRLMKVWRGR